jgi:hypothetical protein
MGIFGNVFLLLVLYMYFRRRCLRKFECKVAFSEGPVWCVID